MCPSCGKGTISISQVLVAQPEGTYSLAGFQPKVAAVMKARAECDSCVFSVYGRLEDPVMDEKGTFTGGHFVVEDK